MKGTRGVTTLASTGAVNGRAQRERRRQRAEKDERAEERGEPPVQRHDGGSPGPILEIPDKPSLGIAQQQRVHSLNA